MICPQIVIFFFSIYFSDDSLTSENIDLFSFSSFYHSGFPITMAKNFLLDPVSPQFFLNAFSFLVLLHFYFPSRIFIPNSSALHISLLCLYYFRFIFHFWAFPPSLFFGLCNVIPSCWL